MSTSREQTVDLDFAGVLSLVQGWLGAELLLVVESGHPPSAITAIRGILTAGPEIAEPPDPDEFGFALDERPFALHRRHFGCALHYPGAIHLEIHIDNRSAGGLAAITHILAEFQ